MIKIILISIISFLVGYEVGNTKKIKTTKRYKKVKPLSKMNKKEYRKAIKDLEIK